MHRLADAVYRLALLAFPREFRQRHGDAMLAEFRAQRERTGWRPIALLRLWTGALADALWHGAGVRREHRRQSGATCRPAAGGPGARLGRHWPHHLRYALRRLRRTPAFSAAVVLILTLGISANAVMFSVVDQLLLRAPAAIGHPAAVRRVYFGNERPRPGTPRGTDRHSYPFVAAIREGVTAFESAAATHRAGQVTLGAGAEAQPVDVDLVNAAYFTLLELRPSAGRFFTKAEDSEHDAAPVAVLAHGFWRGRFAGDPAVVGRTILIDGQRLTVVGVGPRGFAGLEDTPADLWVPVGALAPHLLGPQWATNPGRFAFGLVARLAPGTTAEAADDEATAVLRRAAADFPMFGRDAIAFTAPLARVASPNGVLPEGRVGVWLFAVSAIVLLVAIANVAGLLLTRMLSRRREIAVRLALGISRRRLLAELMTESALLAALAAGMALAVAWAGGRVVQQVLLPGFTWDAATVNVRVLGVTLAAGIITAFGAGLAPAFQASSMDLTASFRTAGRNSGGRAGILRTGLLVAQVALCVVLLVGAGLFVRSLRAAESHDVGLDLDRIVQVRLPAPPGQPPAETIARYRRRGNTGRRHPRRRARHGRAWLGADERVQRRVGAAGGLEPDRPQRPRHADVLRDRAELLRHARRARDSRPEFRTGRDERARACRHCRSGVRGRVLPWPGSDRAVPARRR